ncbi:MAG: succinyl-diaminopimelate desuccinylase [Hyphomicrobiaceae bacterium]|nr:succinyl-diaminopimelate desuccinylase [Hyphomicrobiaceae bacterium]
MLLSPTDSVALAQALIRCQSVTPNEAGALQLMEDVLKPLGFQCHRLTMREAGTPDVENLYARIGSGAPHLCFAGHTDVVPPGDKAMWRHGPFEGVIDGGELYGRGAVDMKGAIAAFTAASAGHLRKMQMQGGLVRGSISLLLTGDEEGPSINGTAKVLDWLAARGEVIDGAIVGEPTNPTILGEEIKIGRRGSLTAEIVITGKQGHVAYPQLAENPVPRLVRVLDRLCRQRLDNGNDDFEPSNLEVTVIGAPNAATNVIPAEAKAKINIRYNSEWTRPRLEAWVRAQIDEIVREMPMNVMTVFSGTGDVFLTKPGRLVSLMQAAVRAETGRDARLTTNGGTSDARFIQAYCPVIEFGLINTLAHHVDERVAVSDLRLLEAIYARFIETFLA